MESAPRQHKKVLKQSGAAAGSKLVAAAGRQQYATLSMTHYSSAQSELRTLGSVTRQINPGTPVQHYATCTMEQCQLCMQGRLQGYARVSSALSETGQGNTINPPTYTLRCSTRQALTACRAANPPHLAQPGRSLECTAAAACPCVPRPAGMISAQRTANTSPPPPTPVLHGCSTHPWQGQ